MQGYGLVVRFRLRPGHEGAFDDLVARTVEGIKRDEPGTLIYVSHAVGDEPAARLFYELYRDRAAFEAHEEQPHTRHFLEARAEHVESYTVDFVDAVVGKGVVESRPA